MRACSRGIWVNGDPDGGIFGVSSRARPCILKGIFMPLWKSNSAARDALAQSAAISRSQAVIEFKMDGTIITANQNFLDAMGYRLDEIQGKHHQMFAPPDLRGSDAYKAFWASLNRGEFQAAEKLAQAARLNRICGATELPGERERTLVLAILAMPSHVVPHHASRTAILPTSA